MTDNQPWLSEHIASRWQQPIRIKGDTKGIERNSCSLGTCCRLRERKINIISENSERSQNPFSFQCDCAIWIMNIFFYLTCYSCQTLFGIQAGSGKYHCVPLFLTFVFFHKRFRQQHLSTIALKQQLLEEKVLNESF